MSIMPAFGRDGILDTNQVQDVVSFVRALSKQEPMRASARRGAALYAANCAVCHGADGRDATMNAYVSPDGIRWALQGPVEISVANITSIVQHPDRQSTFYAWGYSADGNMTSHVSTDGGKTWADDEETVNTIGESGTQPWNDSRNYNPQAIYRGQGKWVMFRTVAEPKRTAYATGVEAGIP